MFAASDVSPDIPDDFSAYMSGEFLDSEVNPKTLYVGNLDLSVSEELIVSLFSQMGTVNKCKIIHEIGNDPYAFVEFADHHAAINGLTSMNKRVLLGKEMKVNWATSPGHQQKVDTSKHFHIFVGDLSPEIDNRTLREAFAPFGEISDAKVIRDLQTLKSKGFGFVSFVNREEAEKGIEQMNGQWLGRRTIRTNWATRKPPAPVPSKAKSSRGVDQMSFHDVFNQASPTNCSVYIGGTNQITTEQHLKEAFSRFGNILEIRCFKQQGYCFVRFDSKESAANAICGMNGQELAGSCVRCSWGKEEGGATQGARWPQNSYFNPPSLTTSPVAPQGQFGGFANYYDWYNAYYGNPAGLQQHVYAQWQQQPPPESTPPPNQYYGGY